MTTMRLIDADALSSILEEWEEKACDGTENDGSDGTTRVLHPVPTTTREMIDLIAEQPTIEADPVKHGLGDQRTNGDRIRTMSDEELAEMLSQLHYGRDEPWSSPFARKFCDSCPAPEYTFDDGRKMDLHECDFTDGKCPHGGDIVWWLQQPAEVRKDD